MALVYNNQAVLVGTPNADETITAATASATVQLRTVDENGAKQQGLLLVEVVGSNTPSWTVDFQGKLHQSGTYANWPYVRTSSAPPQATSVSQLSVTDTTRNRYQILNPPPFFRVVTTRTAGDLIVIASWVAVSGQQILPTNTTGVLVDVLSVVPGTGATSLGKAIDAVAGATDTGIVPLGVRDDALGALTPIEGDYVPLRTDANGALWVHDDAQKNLEGTALASAARTSTAAGADVTNDKARGIQVWFNISASPGGDTVTLSVEVKDPVTESYTSILDSAALSTNGFRSYIAYPAIISTGVPSAITAVSAAPLGRTFRLRVVHSGSGSFTYSVSYCLIV